jgi:hypothetical protein
MRGGNVGGGEKEKVSDTNIGVTGCSKSPCSLMLAPP